MPFNISDTAHYSSDITFPAGTALGGWWNLAVNSTGDIYFSGHLHDSGVDPYNFTGSVVLMTPDGSAYSITPHSGHTAGQTPFTPGDVNHEWSDITKSNFVSTNWESQQFAMAVARFSGRADSGTWGSIEKILVDTANELAAQLGKEAVNAVIALI